MHVRRGERGEKCGKWEGGGARSIALCVAPYPLDLKINNQVIWVGREVAMEEVDASEGGKRRGGGKRERWSTTKGCPIDRVAPLPPST